MAKSPMEITMDMYRHAENKVELERNMMTMLYLKDPAHFNKREEEISNILK
jgi:hypothetical protein